jgi:sugar/nucleoside kinase (ribokinase family)
VTSGRSAQTLTSIGDLVEDIVVWRRGATRTGTDNPATVTRVRGGSAADVAVFAAPFVRSRFIGRVGDDSTGHALTDGLRAAGVEPRVQRTGRTGAVVVHIGPDGERTMFPDRAAAAELADVDVRWIAGSAILHVSGYALTEPASAATVVALARAARAAGAEVSLDASSVDLQDALGDGRFLSLFGDLGPRYYVANADEAARLPVDSLVREGTVCIVKNGAESVTVYENRQPPRDVTVPPVADVRDTTGAGDALAAGVLSTVLAGAPPTIPVERGIALAATVLASAGAGTRTRSPVAR